MKMLRIACVLFSLRNFLDALDGQVARLQRRYKAEAQANSSELRTGSAPTVGFNGHTLDVLTDLFGVVMTSIGIAVFIFRRGAVIARPLSAILSRFTTRHRSRAFGKVVVVGGLVYLAICGCTWENFMLKQVGLFDSHSPTNPAIWELEQDRRVRLNQFLWSISCGDSVFTILITCLFFNVIWEAVQFYFFLGYMWYALLVLNSLYTWYSIILHNPTAAAIVEKAQLA